MDYHNPSSRWGFAASVSDLQPVHSIFDPSSGYAVFIGFILKRLHELDIAWLVGLCVLGAVYYGCARNLDLDAERELIRVVDRS